MIRVFRLNAKHWISTESGSHLLIDGEGNVVGGAAGKLKGQKFVKVTRKSKDVEGGEKEDKKAEEPKAETKEKAEGLKTAKEKYADYDNKIKKMAMDNIQKNTNILIKSGIPNEISKEVAERFIEFSNLYNSYRLLYATTPDKNNLGLKMQKDNVIKKNKELSSLQEKYDIDLENLNVPSTEEWMGFDKIKREKESSEKTNSAPIRVYRASR